MITDIINLPEKFLERIDALVPEEIRDEVLQSYTQKRPTTFRRNRLKITAKKLKEELEKCGISFDQVDWYSDAFVLNTSNKAELMETSLYKEGYLYIQSLSSMIPPLVLDPQENELILDLTAAPGSKTTEIAAMMNNTGEIIANDTSRPRLYRLEANLKLQGVTNVKVSQFPGQIIWEKFPEHFDKTLLDAPCSMEGRFYTGDAKTYRDWTPKKVRDLSTRQKYLLRSAISATKPGGTIVYSTCTLSAEENEGVIDWILDREKGNIELESVEIKGLKGYPGIEEYSKKFNKEVSKTLRIYPSSTMEGFFITKLKKIKTNLSP